MKKLFSILALVTFMFVFPMYGSAGIIGNVNLTETSNFPAGSVSFNGVNYQWLYLDYHVSVNGGAYSEAFCVENMSGPGSTSTPYTLLSIDNGLSAFSLDPSRYLAAAWVADYYKAGNATKAAAQIAIWEIIVDGVSNFSLTSGNLRSEDLAYPGYNYEGWNAGALAIWAARPNAFGDSNTWALAVNPPVAAGEAVGVGGTQNYLVQRVPEPATMLLFGLGLLGLASARRKFKK